MAESEVSDVVAARRQDLAVAVLGGPTTVLDLGGRRFVSDPTFDPPGIHGYLEKTAGPAIPADQLGVVDVVLVSHDQHADNLDASGREFALRAPRLFAPRSSAARLGEPAFGLSAWESWTSDDGSLTITAVPARHGPADAELNDEGFVNCEVVGFVIEAVGTPRTYVSGDNASISLVREIRDRFDPIELAVLHGGAAAVELRFGGRPLSLTAERVVAAAEILQPRHVVVTHQTGWKHFRQGPSDTAVAFEAAGLSDLLCDAPLGSWCRFGP